MSCPEYFDELGCIVEDDAILNLEVEDDDEPFLERFLDDFTEFVDTQQAAGSRLLVYDLAHNRGPILVIGYMMQSLGYPLLAAVEEVWKVYPCIFNPPNLDQLQELVVLARTVGKLQGHAPPPAVVQAQFQADPS
eukprot:SAG31_NODE_19506_length_600_cov_0.580838_1_plen_134_part_10